MDMKGIMMVELARICAVLELGGVPVSYFLQLKPLLVAVLECAVQKFSSGVTISTVTRIKRTESDEWKGQA